VGAERKSFPSERGDGRCGVRTKEFEKRPSSHKVPRFGEKKKTKNGWWSTMNVEEPFGKGGGRGESLGGKALSGLERKKGSTRGGRR